MRHKEKKADFLTAVTIIKEPLQSVRETDHSVVLVYCVERENPQALAVKSEVKEISWLCIFSHWSCYVIEEICASSFQFLKLLLVCM